MREIVSDGQRDSRLKVHFADQFETIGLPEEDKEEDQKNNK